MRRKSLISYAQSQLPFEGLASRAIATPFRRERSFLYMLGVSGIMLSVLYGYFVMASVSHVAAREMLIKESRNLAVDVAGLESSYLLKTRGITEEYARQLGYVAPESRVFVTRQTAYASNAR